MGLFGDEDSEPLKGNSGSGESGEISVGLCGERNRVTGARQQCSPSGLHLPYVGLTYLTGEIDSKLSSSSSETS